MPIPPIQKLLTEKLMQRYCDNKIPKELQDQINLKYVIKGNNITLVESRPFWKDESKWIDSKIAQIRFNNPEKTYTLYYADRNDKWHIYEFLEPSQNLEDLLTELDNDSTGIFFGWLTYFLALNQTTNTHIQNFWNLVNMLQIKVFVVSDTFTVWIKRNRFYSNC